MNWQTRIREAALTSPSGTRLTFDFENVREEFDKKTTAFDFPDADGTFVQDLGHTGRRYPLRMFLSGDDYDLEATAFMDLLRERGTFKLEHPEYGSVDVVPFGKITRRDDLKTAANQAVIEVTFWETIGILYPAAQTDPGSAVLSAVDEYNAAAAGAFLDFINIGTASERVTLVNEYTAVLDQAASVLKAVIVPPGGEVATQFNAILDSVNASIDALVSEPLTLAFQTTLLLQSPARAASAIQARLNAYRDLATSLISGEGAVAPNDSIDSKASNKFHNNDLYASTYVTGSVVSVVNNQFTTKSEALLAAETILDQLSDVNDWREANFESLGQIDTGQTYQQLQEAVALAAGFLVEISFSLKQERSIVLDRNRTIIDLAAELYGSVDDQLDFLIKTNNLSGSEHIEILKGREIVYYV